jgi:F-type H+-transporting ATPase subunit delta
MVNRKAARRYTTALYELAESLKQVDAVKNDFENIKKSLSASRDLRLFLESPVINPEKKLLIIKEIFSGKVSDLTLKFLVLVAEKNRINILNNITESILKLIDDRRGIVKAFVTTAIEIPDIEKNSITDTLKKYTGKEIQAEYSVNNSIKGGFIAMVEDKIIDASIERQLEILKEQFIAGSFNN